MTATTRIGFIAGVLTYVSFAVMIWMMLVLVTTPAKLRWVLYAFVFSNLANAVIGIAQYKLHFLWIVSQVRILQASGLPIEVIIHQGFDGFFRIDALTGTPDLLAMNLLATMPFTAAFGFRTTSPTRRLFWLGSTVVLAAAMGLTFARGTVVGLAAVVVLATFRFGLRRAGPFLLAGMILVGVVLVAVPPFRERLVSSIPRAGAVQVDTGQPEAAAWRLKSYGFGLQMARDFAFRPAGIRQQLYLWEDYAPDLVFAGTEWSTPLHNTYLLAIIELGLWGAALYAVLTIVTWRRLTRARRVFAARGRHDLADVCLSTELALIGVLVANLFYPLMEFRYYWLFVGFAAVLTRFVRDEVADVDR